MLWCAYHDMPCTDRAASASAWRTRRRATSLRYALRFAYDWTVERLPADPTLTGYGLQKVFAGLRRATPHLQAVERKYQNAAMRQARTAADTSKRGNGSRGFRSKKRNGAVAVACDVPPRFVDSMHASRPGLGAVRLRDERPYGHQRNWLHGSRPFRIVDTAPGPWRRVKPGDRTYRPYVTYAVPEPGRAHTGVAAGTDRHNQPGHSMQDRWRGGTPHMP